MKKDEGVSPVIAVMLILGLTVVLLGMAAAMFMGITSNATDNMDTSFLHPTNEWDVIKIVYFGNGNTEGDVPIDESAPHNPGDIVTVAGKGNLNRSGYNFACWNTKSDTTGDSYFEGFELVIDGYTTLFAVWYKKDYYSVSYNSRGHKVPMPASQSIEIGESITIATAESSGGKTFVKWEGSNGKEYYPGKTYEDINGNIILYAVWEDNPKPQNP